MAYRKAGNFKRDAFRKVFIWVKLHVTWFKTRGKCCSHPHWKHVDEKDLPPHPEPTIWFIKGGFADVEISLLKRVWRILQMQLLIQRWGSRSPEDARKGVWRRISRAFLRRAVRRRVCLWWQRPLITAGFVRFNGAPGFDAFVCAAADFITGRWDFPGATFGYQRLLLGLLWGRRPVRRLDGPITSTSSLLKIKSLQEVSSEASASDLWCCEVALM